MSKFTVTVIKTIFTTVLLVLTYFVWTGTQNVNNLLVIAGLALIVSIVFNKVAVVPFTSVKKIAYAIWYLVFIIIEIIKANLDVVRRIIQPTIPLKPGIVTVKTKLKSPMGRLALANSITLTPGTLTVDIKDDILFIHWIDVSDKQDEVEATKEIVAGFEKYLEVIFG